jgi:hypothetical protein
VVPKITSLYFAPADQYVEAQIMRLTPEMAETGIHRSWWLDESLLEEFDSAPIDRYWNWNEMEIEYNGRLLDSVKAAILTGDRAVQGAMMISTEPVSSLLTPTVGALFVELLFTAPRNRPKLRRDGRNHFLGVGTELLTWGVWLSREKGCEGRLLLDASPEYIGWYEKRGL